MTEFKQRISELIIDHKDEQLLLENLNLIYNWPEVMIYDENDDTTLYESLSTENCSVIDITDDYIEVTCEGNSQQSHIIRIELVGGELAVTLYDPHEFLVGMNFEEVLEELKS